MDLAQMQPFNFWQQHCLVKDAEFFTRPDCVVANQLGEVERAVIEKYVYYHDKPATYLLKSRLPAHIITICWRCYLTPLCQGLASTSLMLVDRPEPSGLMRSEFQEETVTTCPHNHPSDPTTVQVVKDTMKKQDLNKVSSLQEILASASPTAALFYSMSGTPMSSTCSRPARAKKSVNRGRGRGRGAAVTIGMPAASTSSDHKKEDANLEHTTTQMGEIKETAQQLTLSGSVSIEPAGIKSATILTEDANLEQTTTQMGQIKETAPKQTLIGSVSDEPARIKSATIPTITGDNESPRARFDMTVKRAKTKGLTKTGKLAKMVPAQLHEIENGTAKPFAPSPKGSVNAVTKRCKKDHRQGSVMSKPVDEGLKTETGVLITLDTFKEVLSRFAATTNCVGCENAVTSPSVISSPLLDTWIREMADEDSTQHSQSSRSSTPNVSNPGTPRQELAQEVRATPPLAVPSTSSTVQRTIPGQAQPPSLPAAHSAAAAATAAAATAAAMAMAPQQQGVHAMPPHQSQSKYSSLLAVIEDMGRDIRPTYAGNRTSSERLKRSIVHARILVRECLMECERSART